STHNSRIERLWVELGTQFVRRWRAFFTRLENRHMLNPQNPHHLWILHVLFLPAINQDCRDFQLEWNCHPIDSVDTNLKSPVDLRFLGQTEFGVYRDDCEGVHPDVISEFYGVHKEPIMRKRHQSGAGHPVDEEASGDEEDGLTAHAANLVNQEQQQQHVNEDMAFVPSHQSPFTNPENEAVFFGMLKQVIDLQIIPEGFGLRPDEWEDGHYPAYETIRLGRWQSKELEVSLADEVWYRRACLWCQALVCMTHFTTLMGLD
ncbi:hypothetical protein OG21DRAFT_1420531, partial [Imleria badia]